ncbi:glycosyltransferase family 4 protein [Patescibacteria group bacterium]
MNRVLIKKVDAIITISETSKKDIVRILNINPKKIFVTYLAPRNIFKKIENKDILEKIAKKYNLPSEFVLYVGDVNYNKNILTLAKACKNIKKPLVIVGKQASDEAIDKSHIENKPFIDFLRKYQDDKDVIRLGYVKDEDLVYIYNLAQVYCQPSFYEGFGLPVIEALACGLPVVASKIQTHVEVFNDSALYVNAKDYLDFSKKIKMVIEDEKLRVNLINNGLKRTKEYSWKKTADKTYKVYKSLL